MSTERAAENQEFDRRIKLQTEAFARNTPYHSIELPGGRVIEGIIPVANLRARLAAFPLEQDLRGKRCLDVGAASGWNSFELERRGAEVVALDCVEYEEFIATKRLLDSKVEYCILDVDEITSERLGTFDYVLFFGVLYHVRHPLLIMEKICEVTRGHAFVESFVIDDNAHPENGPCVLEFYETDQLGGQIDNWYGPSVSCLAALCRSGGFASVKHLYTHDRRAGFVCGRRWELPQRESADNEEAPLLCFALNNRHHHSYFHGRKDEYVCVFFKSPQHNLTREDVQVEIDGYGVPALVLTKVRSDQWQANVRLPSGLTPGLHEIRLAICGGQPSNLLTLYVGISEPAKSKPLIYTDQLSPPRLILLENSFDQGKVFRGYRAEQLNVLFSSAVQNLQLADVQVEIDGMAVSPLAFGKYSVDIWQANARLPRDLQSGEHEVRILTCGLASESCLRFAYHPVHRYEKDLRAR